MNDMNGKKIEVGAVVTVGMRFEGHPTRMGEGRMVADEYTGKAFRVVALRSSKSGGADSAALAPSNLVGVDESDEVVDIACRRLMVAGEWSVG